MLISSSSLLLLVLSLLATGSVDASDDAIQAKMVTSAVPAGRRLSSAGTLAQESNAAIFVDTCVPGTTYEYPLSGGGQRTPVTPGETGR